MTKEWLSLLSSVDKIRPEFLVALACSSLFLLLSPSWLLQALGLLAVIGTIKTWLGLSLLLSLFLLFAKASSLAIRYVGDQLRLLRSKRFIHQLTGEELGFLGEFIDRDVASIQAPIGDGLAGALMAKGLIFRASSMGNVLTGFAYGIQPWVRDYLCKRPHLWNKHAEARARARISSRGQYNL
jgi:hypothetical protein